MAPTWDVFDQPPGQIRWIWGKLADHVGDHVVSSPEGAVLVTSSGTKSSYPRPPQSLNPSKLSFTPWSNSNLVTAASSVELGSSPPRN